MDGVVHLLSEQAGRHLLVLAEHFELVWCSGWEEKANEYLPGALSIPGPLPYLTFGPTTSLGAAPPTSPGAAPPTSPGAAPPRHWKLDAIDVWAGPDHPWRGSTTPSTTAATSGRPGPTLLVATQPASGLTEREVDTLLAWTGAAAS